MMVVGSVTVGGGGGVGEGEGVLAGVVVALRCKKHYVKTLRRLLS